MNKILFLIVSLFLTTVTVQAQVVGQNFFNLFAPGKVIKTSSETVIASKKVADGNTLIFKYIPTDNLPDMSFNAMATIRCESSIVNIIFISLDSNYNIKGARIVGGYDSKETAEANATWAVNELITFPGFDRLRIELKLNKINSKTEMNNLLEKIKTLQNKDQMKRRLENGEYMPSPPPAPRK
ncbi:MAG: hypothetical protein WCQ47_01360 [bacterium]